MMKIVIKRDNEVSASERPQLDSLFSEAFQPDEHITQWAGDDWTVLVWENDELVSHVGIVARMATVDGQPVHLGGIGGVATRMDWRRQGLAEAALKVAQTFMHDRLAVDFGLLVCGEVMIPYYAKFGWKLLDRPMLIDQPGGKVTYSEPIMILPVCKSDWPEGEIDLCGPPW
jgi:aminoglycoside 2'-N-acetyltransferase I